MEGIKGSKDRHFHINGSNFVLFCAIIVVIAIFTSINHNFLSYQNFINILVAASLIGLVAIGHTYLIIAGLNDLSAGSLAAFSGVVAALLVKNMGFNFWLALIFTIVIAVLVGVFNAWMVTGIKLDPFIATLVSQAIFRGFAYIISNGKAVPISDKTFIKLGNARFLTIPLTVWILIIAYVIFGFILAKTKFGRSVYAIGGNKEAARLAGLNPNRIIYTCFMMMGALCAVGGVILAARMNSGQPSACVNLEFDSITAVILGGVSFTGGVGNIGGTVLVVFLIQSFNTGLTMVGVQSFWQYVARGALLLMALATDYIRKKNAEKIMLEDSMRNL